MTDYKQIPERIYLQVHEDDVWAKDLHIGETTWCVDKINDTDVEYVLASRLEECEAQLKFERGQMLKRMPL